MPGEWRGQWLRRVLDVNDTTVHGACGRARGVKQERTKREERTLLSEAYRFGKSSAEVVP